MNRKIVSISCGESHTIASVVGMLPFDRKILNNRNEEYMFDVVGWGCNSLGQVTGRPKIPQFDQPVVLTEFIGKNIVSVSCSRTKSAAVDRAGGIYEWGGSEKETGISVKQTVVGAAEIHQGNTFSIVLADGKVYFWGELKNKARNIIRERNPTVVSGELKIKSISVGFDHVLASNEEEEVDLCDSSCLGLDLMSFLKSDCLRISIA